MNSGGGSIVPARRHWVANARDLGGVAAKIGSRDDTDNRGGRARYVVSTPTDGSLAFAQWVGAVPDQLG